MKLHDSHALTAVEAPAETSSVNPLLTLEIAQAGVNSLLERSTNDQPATPEIGKQEWRVVAVVLAVLGLAELSMQLGKQYLSKDIQHLQSIPALASNLVASTNGRPRIAFLGNSLTRFGIDECEFSQAHAARSGTTPNVVKIVPDNTAIADWFYVYRNNFTAKNQAPDVLVIGFALRHLSDTPSNQPGRLAQFFCNWSNWPELCRFDLPNSESRTAFVMNRISALCGNRERVIRRVFDTLIPGYRDGLDQINVLLQPDASRQTNLTYERLKLMVGDARRHNVRLVFVAMPLPEKWEFDPALLEVVHENDLELLDMRDVFHASQNMFVDSMHMNEAASKIFSRKLAARLVPLSHEKTGR